MSESNSSSEFQAQLARCNEVMLNHFPLPGIPEVFAGAPTTLRQSLEVVFQETSECGGRSDRLEGALSRLVTLCAVIEHHLVMARIQAPVQRKQRG